MRGDALRIDVAVGTVGAAPESVTVFGSVAAFGRVEN